MSHRRNFDLPKQTLVHVELSLIREDATCIVLNLSTRTLSLLLSQDMGPKLLWQERFTKRETNILLSLLTSYPLHCSYATLLACFQKAECGFPTEEEIGCCRSTLLDVQEKNTWNQFLHPIRCAISRARLKVQELGLEIVPLEEKGYQLLCSEVRSVTDFPFICSEVFSGLHNSMK